MKKLILFAIMAIAGVANAQTTYIATGASWKYLDNGSNQNTAWRDSTFNDMGWVTGNAQLGYGEGDEATAISFGGNPSDKHETYYFRKKINISNLGSLTDFTVNLKRDDGAVVYVNGNEVWRQNMNAGTVAFNTLAATDASDDGQNFLTQNIPTTHFVNGDNYIAVEVHQFTLTSSDVSFDFSLVGNLTPPTLILTRNPYLQIPTPTGMTVRWRTNIAVASKVQYGLSAGSLTSSVVDNAPKTEHIITLTGLTANTKYFYSVGDLTNVLQGDANNYFTTSPVAGTVKDTRIWVLGDQGTSDQSPRNVRDAFLTYSGSRRADLMLMVGDNAYGNGTDAEYETAAFQNQLENVFKNMPLTPAAGNHDVVSGTAQTQTDDYFKIFSMPVNAEAGGFASGTKAYYSYNYGQIHLICLESTTSSFRQNGSPMLQWLQNDLAANAQKWTIVYWHHPPHSKGSHDCDADIEMIEMRQNVTPILDQYKVDLVLNGHSHSYERSMFMHGHYGNVGSFTTVHKIDSTSGQISAPYLKLSSKQYKGTVYVQTGCSGVAEPVVGSWPHPAMKSYINNTLGSFVIDVNNDSLTGRFIDSNTSNPSVLDAFRIVKQCDLTASITPVPDQCGSSPIVTLTATPAGGTYSGPGVSGNTFSPATAGLGLHTINYNYSDGRCSTSTSTQIRVTTPQITAPSTTICAGANVIMTAATGTSYQWYRNAGLLAGATNSTYAASANGTYYCNITSASCSGNSNSLVLTVVNNPTPTLTNTTALSFCSPGSVVLTSSTFSGITYQWLKNGVNISGATNQTYSASTSGAYRVSQTANGCAKLSPTKTVTNATSVAAAITATGSTSFCSGGSVTLTETNSIPGYSYQWKNNGTNISGATSIVYVATVAGSYTCFVSASCGSATSNAIVVTVITVNANITPSGTVDICNGSSVLLSASTGTGYNYQWKLNGNNISGATASTYSANAAGNYVVDITTTCGTVSSVATTVNLITPSVNISAGSSTTICTGSSVTLLVDNIISGYAYQWRKNGVDISGATNTTYNANTAGAYICFGSGLCGNATSNTLTVVVEGVNATITPSGTVTVCNGISSLLTATSGTGLTYQWKLNGNNISGATSISYNASAAGNYIVDITSSCGLSSSPATTLVLSPGVIAISPTPTASFCPGLSVLLSATTGTNFTYQWLKNNANISGAVSATYTASNPGTYTVKITQNGNCSATTAATVVTQINNPAATISPSTAQTICNGQQVNFTTNTFAGVIYQWIKNGADITGATNQNYAATTTGNYRVRQTANGCQKTSATVSVTVNTCANRLSGNNNSTDEFSTSPNPFNDVTTLTIPSYVEKEKLTVMVYNVIGEKVWEAKNVKENELKIYKGKLQPGIYILKANDNSSTLYIQRIVLN